MTSKTEQGNMIMNSLYFQHQLNARNSLESSFWFREHFYVMLFFLLIAYEKILFTFKHTSTRGGWYSTTQSGVEYFTPRVNKSNIQRNKTCNICFNCYHFVGALFSIMACCEVVITLIASSTVPLVYKSTLDKSPNTIFFIFTGFASFVTLLVG